MKHTLLLFIGLLVGSCQPSTTQTREAVQVADKHTIIQNPELAFVNLPEGYVIDYYATNLKDARSLCLSPNGVLYVSTRQNKKVYAVQDTDGDYKADKQYLVASGLFMPNGVAWKDGDLYVAEVNRVIRFEDIDNNLNDIPKPEVVYDDYPDKTHHGWKYIAFGPDGWLYVPVGAPCNICESEDEVFNSITRLNVETGEMQILHQGIRNTVGFDWHPKTDELWFTENGGDWLGDDMPACELNYAPQSGMHFGYPYCHQGDYPDPKLGYEGACEAFTPPAQKLGPHVAPLGMEFIEGPMFPKEWQHDVLIAEHGSWNRSTPIGYRITRVPIDGNTGTGYEVFADGWLDEDTEDRYGRPVDLEYLPDGSLLVSDDYAGCVYRISEN